MLACPQYLGGVFIRTAGGDALAARHRGAVAGGGSPSAALPHPDGLPPGSVKGMTDTMTRNTISRMVVVALAASMLAAPATAWGPRAHQAIAAMALQVINQDYPSIFRPERQNFETDVLQGAKDGYAALEGLALTSDDAVVQAIAAQIQLLRDVRPYGPTSYYAYRMGVLSALVADVMFPYGFTWNAAEADLARRIERDIEDHLERFTFSPTQHRRAYVRDARDYFRDRRSFAGKDKVIIEDDYARGAGFDGFLRRGAQAYFTRSVETIADVWHTVLRVAPDPTARPTSQPMLAAYFVQEIGFLLNDKRNFHQATEVYKSFDRVAEQLPHLYEVIGDQFYGFDSPEGVNRGVREWQIAHSLGGPERRRVAAKLSQHYLSEGHTRFAEGTRKGSSDTALPTALRAFEQAMDFDRTNEEAADMIHKTHVAIQERRARLELVLGIIAEGEKVTSQADQMKLDGDLGNAMRTYRQAIGFFEAVDDEFTEQERIAKEKIRQAGTAIGGVIRSIMDRASDSVDEGDRLREEHQYERAIQAYTSVSGIIGVIDEDENPTFAGEKRDMAALAEKRIEEAKVAKLRYEQAQAQQEAQQAGGGGGAGRARPQ